jgi:hypothetical protein
MRRYLINSIDSGSSIPANKYLFLKNELLQIFYFVCQQWEHHRIALMVPVANTIARYALRKTSASMVALSITARYVDRK